MNQGHSESVSQWRRDHQGGTLQQHVPEVKERPTFEVNWFSDGG
jgi:hypothetical protein